MADNIKDLQRLFDKALNDIPQLLPRIVEVEGMKFIAENFKNEGFNDGSGYVKWAKRKTADNRGRDITRYRTDRVGSKGSLNRYGSKNEGRAVLVGHATGGDKLKNSFKSKSSLKEVVFYTYKDYAERHNEGTNGMPKRQFMGKSRALNKAIDKKITSELDKIFK